MAGTEFNLDETIKFLDSYTDETKTALQAIQTMKLDNVEPTKKAIKDALEIIKSNKVFRKYHLSTTSKTKTVSSFSVLSQSVLTPMTNKLTLGNKRIDTKTTNSHSRGRSMTVQQWQELRGIDIEKTTKKELERVSRQADVQLYQYIYDQVNALIPHDKTLKLSSGFNFLTALSRLTNRLSIVVKKAERIQKGFNPTGKVTGQSGVIYDGNNRTGTKAARKTEQPVVTEETEMTEKVPSKTVNEKPKDKPKTIKKITIEEKKLKWLNNGDGFKYTSLVKVPDYRKFTDKKKDEVKDYQYDEQKFIDAINKAKVDVFLLTNKEEWISKLANTSDVNNLKVFKAKYGTATDDLPVWCLSVAANEPDSPEMQSLKKELNKAGVKMACVEV